MCKGVKNAMDILDILQKNVVNMDIIELNMDIGSKSEEQKSGKNTIRLFKHFLHLYTPCKPREFTKCVSIRITSRCIKSKTYTILCYKC